MSNASEQSAVTPRTGRPFTFTRTRGNSAGVEFFPGAGSTLHFANRDVDTFTARSLPAGLLQSGDEVTVKYNGTTVFKGEVSRIVDRHGGGPLDGNDNPLNRIQDVIVAGPWDQLGRLVFKQTWGNQTVNFSSSRVILGQTAAGVAQTMDSQIAEIADYAAQYCGMALAPADNHAPLMCLPLDEARDITCADAIRRELRFFPKLIVRFNYASGTPALQIVDPAHADTASYMASIPMTNREYTYNAHPVKYVDVTVDAVEIAVNGDAASFHQEYPAIPSGTSPLDVLHVTVPLANGGGSTTNESFKIETEPLPGQDGSPYTGLDDKNWWKAKHPRLENVAPTAIEISDVRRTDSGETNVYQRILKNAKDEVEAAGKHCRVTRFTCKCKISTTDYEEEEIHLSMDFLTTDATTRTYTVQTGSTATAGEELPAGLAQALYEQRSQRLVSEVATVRLGASFPKLGDKLVETVGNATETLFLQSFDVDCYDLTARLSFGQPEHLSADDMKSLLNGFRQRGSASTAVLREQKGAAEGNEPDAPGGIPPIASSEWAPGTKVKDFVKKDGGGAVKFNATSAGEIDLNTADLNATTAKFRNLTYTDANGNQQTVRILATAAATIPATTSQGTPAQIPLSDNAPADPVLDHNGTTQGTADPGTANEAARADHVHKLPATVVDTVNVQTITGRKTFKTSVTDFVDGNGNIRVRISNFGSGEIELLGSNPHVDFHYGDASGGASFAQDYNVRIINNADGQVTFIAPDGTTLSVRRSTQLSDTTSATSTEFATMGWANDKFLRKTGIAPGGNITIADGTGANAGKKVISATVPAHPATTTIDVITGISFVPENGQIKAKLKKTKLTVHGAVEVPGTTNADLPLYAQTVAVDGAYDTGTHKLTLDRLTGVRIGSSNATTAKDVTTATPHTEG